MRLTFLLLLQFCTTILVLAQHGISLESEFIESLIFDGDQVPSIEGKLEHYSSSQDPPIIKYKALIPGLKGQTSKVAKVNANGVFYIELEYGLPYQQVFLTVGEHLEFQILAAEELYIDIDMNKIHNATKNTWNEVVNFRGKDAGHNTFINDYAIFKSKKKAQIEKKKFSAMMNQGSGLPVKVGQIKKIYDQYKTIEADFAKAYNAEHLWILENDRRSKMYADILSLYVGHKMGDAIQKEVLEHQPLVLSNSANKYYDMLSLYFTYLNKHELDLTTAKARKIKAAPDEDQSLINRFMEVVERRRLGMDYDLEFYESGIDWYKKRYEDQFRSERLSFISKKLSGLSAGKVAMIIMKAQPFETKEREKYIEHMEGLLACNWCKNLISQELEKEIKRENSISEHLASTVKNDSIIELGQLVGRSANGSVLYTSTSANTEDLLSTLRNYYQGSAVVVNIWSIWCAPCVSDMRQSKYLENKLSNLPVEIVYLHIHNKSDVNQWKDMISETMVGGDHIYLDPSLSADLMQELDITGFPSSFLIDLNGRYDPNCITSLSKLEGKELRKVIGSNEELVLEK